MVKDEIIKTLEDVTGVKDPQVEFPENEIFGDYSSNVAIVNKLHAEEVVEKINKLKLPFTAESKSGFINFWLNKDVLVDNLIQIDKEKDKYGFSASGKTQTWGIEHTSPNPNKAMHLGHLRNNITGMAIANLAEAIGVKVIRDCMDNNRGIAMAKLMWGFLKFARKDGKETKDISYWFGHRDEWQTPESIHMRPDRFVDQLYMKGSLDFEKSKETEANVRKLVVDWEAEDPINWALWKLLLGYSYLGQNLTLERLGSKWDKVWHEHEHYRKGKNLVEKGLKKGIFKKLPDGAVVTNLSKYKLTDTIVIKSDSTSLYITQDLALTKLKRETFGADKLFWVIGPEQSLAMKQMFAVCEQLGIGKLDDFIHLAYGYMSIKGQGKMSSRLGNVIYVDDLLDTARDKVKKIMEKSDFSGGEIEKISEIVGVGAVKYSILKVGRMQDVAFDLKESISLEGNSGPYLQYTVARTNGVIAKNINPKSQTLNESKIQINNEEMAILRKLCQFEGIIANAAKTYSPNILCNYLYDLASKFNTFYNKYRILDSDNVEFRLRLTDACGRVLKTGLGLLGIQTPESM